MFLKNSSLMVSDSTLRHGDAPVSLSVLHACSVCTLGWIDLLEILEGEHEGADAFSADFGVFLLQHAHELRFGVAVEVVEDVGHDLVRIAALGFGEVAHEFEAQRFLDAVEHFLLSPASMREACGAMTCPI